MSIALAFLLLLNWGCSHPAGKRGFDEKEWLAALKKEIKPSFAPEKVGEIDAAMKSYGLKSVDEKYIYLVNGDAQSIDVYDRSSCKLLRKVGRPGEGPGEFKSIQGVHIYPDYIFVNSMGKNSYFNPEGSLIREEKVPGHLIPCMPVGENAYVTNSYGEMPGEQSMVTQMGRRRIVLLSKDFNEKKTLMDKVVKRGSKYDFKNGCHVVIFFPDNLSFQIYGDHIYTGANTEDLFLIEGFNAGGGKVLGINRPFPKRKITAGIKAIMKSKEHHPYGKEDVMKVEFNHYLPSYGHFIVNDGKIFVFMFPEEGDIQRVLVLDLAGKLLCAAAIPFDLAELGSQWRKIFRGKGTMFKSVLYYLEENDITGKIDLWKQRIF